MKSLNWSYCPKDKHLESRWNWSKANKARSKNDKNSIVFRSTDPDIFFPPHLQPQITQVKPVQWGLNALPPAVLVKHQERIRWSLFCLANDWCVLNFSSNLTLVPAQSAPEAHWPTSSRLVSLTSWTLVDRWLMSWIPQNPYPLIPIEKRMTCRETCWCSSFWHLLGEACSTVSHVVEVLLLYSIA